MIIEIPVVVKIKTKKGTARIRTDGKFNLKMSMSCSRFSRSFTMLVLSWNALILSTKTSLFK